jgi:hypothetical protein
MRRWSVTAREEEVRKIAEEGEDDDESVVSAADLTR